MTKSDGKEKGEKVFQESLKVLAEVERANDHTPREEEDMADVMMRHRANSIGLTSAHGVDFGTPKTNIDEYWVWPESRFQREGRLHKCKACGEAKPYDEFTKTYGSTKFTGTRCDKCVGDKRSPLAPPRAQRRRNVSWHDSVGAQGDRATA
jgi:hypothetical protein